MAKVYVANCSFQDQLFGYRVPGDRNLRMQHIPLNAQAQLSGDLLPEDIEAIVEQHEQYGLVAAQSVGQARTHVTLVYSVGKPVSDSQRKQVQERNLALMAERSKETRAAAALGIAQSVTRRLSEIGRDPSEMHGMEVHIEEERSDGGRRSVDESVVISDRQAFIDRTRGGNPLAPPPPAPSRRRRRAA